MIGTSRYVRYELELPGETKMLVLPVEASAPVTAFPKPPVTLKRATMVAGPMTIPMIVRDALSFRSVRALQANLVRSPILKFLSRPFLHLDRITAYSCFPSFCVD